MDAEAAKVFGGLVIACAAGAMGTTALTGGVYYISSVSGDRKARRQASELTGIPEREINAYHAGCVMHERGNDSIVVDKYAPLHDERVALRREILDGVDGDEAFKHFINSPSVRDYLTNQVNPSFLARVYDMGERNLNRVPSP